MLDRSSPISLYLQLKAALCRDIRNKRMKVGDKLPTIRDIIQSHSVSMPVVRQALTELERDKIISIEHGRGSYLVRIPEEQNVGVLPQGKMILFITSTYAVHGSLVSRVLTGVQEEAARHQAHIIYANPTVERPLEALLSSSMYLGAILTGDIRPSEVDLVRKANLPLVLAGDVANQHRLVSEFPSVANDDFTGGYLAGKHLISQGHERFGVIAGRASLYYWQMRVEGFMQAVLEAGLESSDVKIARFDDQKPADGRQGMEILMNDADRPTAIFAANDRYAYGVYAWCQDRGIRIPESVSVVGFDDLDLSADLSPPLTSVRPDARAFGRHAMQLLMEQIDNPDHPPAQRMLPVTLIERESVTSLSYANAEAM